MDHENTGSGLSYLLSGAGHWMNRWECTGHDWALALFSIGGCLWMIWGGARYAWRAGRSVGGRVSEHNRQLRYVFCQLVMINALTMLVVWILPAYYIAALLCWVNAYQTWRLNAAKEDELLDEKLREGEVAIARLDKLRRGLGTEGVVAVEEAVDNGTCEDLVTKIRVQLDEAKELVSCLTPPRRTLARSE